MNYYIVFFLLSDSPDQAVHSEHVGVISLGFPNMEMLKTGINNLTSPTYTCKGITGITPVPEEDWHAQGYNLSVVDLTRGQHAFH